MKAVIVIASILVELVLPILGGYFHHPAVPTFYSQPLLNPYHGGAFGPHSGFPLYPTPHAVSHFPVVNPYHAAPSVPAAPTNYFYKSADKTEPSVKSATTLPASASLEQYRGFAYHTDNSHGASSDVIFFTGPESVDLMKQTLSTLPAGPFFRLSDKNYTGNIQDLLKEARTAASSLVDTTTTPNPKAEETTKTDSSFFPSLPKEIQDSYSSPEFKTNDPVILSLRKQLEQQTANLQYNPTASVQHFYNSAPLVQPYSLESHYNPFQFPFAHGFGLPPYPVAGLPLVRGFYIRRDDSNVTADSDSVTIEAANDQEISGRSFNPNGDEPQESKVDNTIVAPAENVKDNVELIDLSSRSGALREEGTDSNSIENRNADASTSSTDAPASSTEISSTENVTEESRPATDSNDIPSSTEANSQSTTQSSESLSTTGSTETVSQESTSEVSTTAAQ